MEKHGTQDPQIRLAYVNECGAGLLLYIYIRSVIQFYTETHSAARPK
jgi:hypothetical protein